MSSDKKKTTGELRFQAQWLDAESLYEAYRVHEALWVVSHLENVGHRLKSRWKRSGEFWVVLLYDTGEIQEDGTLYVRRCDFDLGGGRGIDLVEYAEALTVAGRLRDALNEEFKAKKSPRKIDEEFRLKP